MSTATTPKPATSPRRPDKKAQRALSAVLLAPDGVTLRNFVINNYVIRHLGELAVFHNCPFEVPDPIRNNAREGVTWEPMLAPREVPLSFTLRQMLTFAHLYWGDTSAMRYTRQRSMGGSWKTKAANHLGRVVGRLMAHQPGIRFLEQSYFRAVRDFSEVEYYRRALDAHRPQVVLSGSHRAPAVLPAVLAAKSLGIPVVTFVASWDNLTSKSRIAAPFDHYLVWSNLMRDELLHYYPHVRPGQITVVGTPQFDCYADPKIMLPRAEFFRREGFDPSRPLICYSGGDAGNCPQDPDHIETLMNFVRNGKIRGNPQVLLRPMPVDDGTRYEAIRQAFPELIYRQPAWDHLDPGDWSRCVPRPEDVQFLANITQHADANVNIASTMTLDYGLHDRPVVNIRYDAGTTNQGRPPSADFYTWEHYKPIVDFGAARIANSPEELAEQVNFVLDNPDADREGRRKLAELQVGQPTGAAGELIAEALQRIARDRA